MNINLQENISLKEYCTLKVGGIARYYVEISDKTQLLEVATWAKNNKLELFPLGGGSNIVFKTEHFNKVVCKINIKGLETTREDANSVTIKAGAGENWDSFVERSVKKGLYGIEMLSLIPGTVGATPVQNVGAYGQEVSNTIVAVEVFDTKTNTLLELKNKDCNFRYRDSIFKSEEKGRYIITAVSFAVSKQKPEDKPLYTSLQAYLDSQSITNPTLQQIRDGVIAVRTSKLPDPKVIPNVGSFFENPIIPHSQYVKLQEQYPDIPGFDTGNGTIKLFAGWLIEQAGLKGYKQNNFATYDKHALVIIHTGNGSVTELMEFKNYIIQTIYNKFGVTLEPEPEFVG